MTAPQTPCIACLDFPAGLAPATLAGLAEAALRFSDQVAVRPGESLFVELGRNRWLGSPEGFAVRLLALGRRFAGGSAVKLGLGPDAAVALALARWGRPGLGMEALPLEALAAFAAPFGSDAEVAAKVAALLLGLASLGLGTLGGFLALPAQSLGSRFGPNAALLAGRLRGDFGMAWPRFAPPAKLEEVLDLRDPATYEGCGDLDSLRFHLKHALGLLCARLRGRSLRAGALLLELWEEERGRAGLKPRRLELKLSLPLGAPLELLKVLGEALEAQLGAQSLGAPLKGLRLRVTETAPGLSGQGHFFERHAEEVEAWNTLVDRLSQKLGPDQVFLADLARCYLPERAWTKTLLEPGAPRPAVAEPPDLGPRPTRLLSEPLPLLREGDHLGPLDDGRHWEAISWDGPERLDGEWWQRPFSRDYWKVATAEGAELWVFSKPGAPEGRLWLQGFFD